MIAAANWKMHKTLREAAAWVEEVASSVPKGVTAIVFPPHTAIHAVREAVGSRPLQVGGQNVFYEEAGAFTGEISPGMLKDLGCTHVLVGHSERRETFGETDRDVAAKLRAVLATELTPVLCVGDSLEDFERGDSSGAIRRQLGVAVKGLTGDQMLRLVIAYEPVWAIGTGRAATAIEAMSASKILRDGLLHLYGAEVAETIPLLYGGSVTPENVRGYLGLAGMDGVLVGSASLDARTFVSLMQEAAREEATAP